MGIKYHMLLFLEQRIQTEMFYFELLKEVTLKQPLVKGNISLQKRRGGGLMKLMYFRMLDVFLIRACTY